jgi:hypothetical protein
MSRNLELVGLAPPEYAIDHHRVPSERRARSDVTMTCGFSQKPREEVGLVRINNGLRREERMRRGLGERLGGCWRRAPLLAKNARNGASSRSLKREKILLAEVMSSLSAIEWFEATQHAIKPI